MSASASDQGNGPDIVEAERDDHETRISFGTGKVPYYVAFAWFGLFIGYVIYMVAYALPDLRAW